mmetsp:Transcript_15515/g.33645  ORF Transcript_15515/g.33645 Transcript_15515/m.33645 type:complete len:647 (+) Transcript_15515:37-1977(+)
MALSPWKAIFAGTWCIGLGEIFLQPSERAKFDIQDLQLQDEGAAANGLPVIEIDMYRAMTGTGIGKFTEEDDNLASLGGVLKYLMTEVIPEYDNAKNRWQRKYNIDTILRQRFKVKNKPLPASGTNFSVQFVDFGPFAAYDRGQSTNPGLDDAYLNQNGDWVGIQLNQDPGFANSMQEPLFWYSVGGFCPNLPWTKLPLPDGSTTARCTADKDFCQPKGTRKKPNDLCWANDNETIMGGLCENSTVGNSTTPEMDPTGETGCTYTYGLPLSVNLDKLTGILDQDCKGGRKCKNWWDFRQNCADESLQKMFDNHGNLVPAKNVSAGQEIFCVEYDMHPDCRGDCSNDICKKSEDYEVALPFWKGRCDPDMNLRRIEALAVALEIENADKTHQTVDEDILKQETTCASTPCSPSTYEGVSVGGPYCSRSFSGVCVVCFIRGAQQESSAHVDHPDCPFNILEIKDYGPKSSTPSLKCSSKKPSDSCCLYMPDSSSDACDGSDDPDDATLDTDGLALVARRCYREGNSSAMLAYAERVAKSLGGELNTTKDVEAWAYMQWSLAPTWNSNGESHHKTYDDFSKGVSSFFPASETTTTTTGIATTTTPAPHKGGIKGLYIVLAVVGVLVLGGGIAGICVCCRRRDEDYYEQA